MNISSYEDKLEAFSSEIRVTFRTESKEACLIWGWLPTVKKRASGLLVRIRAEMFRQGESSGLARLSPK
jgi:hypothetical protein